SELDQCPGHGHGPGHREESGRKVERRRGRRFHSREGQLFLAGVAGRLRSVRGRPMNMKTLLFVDDDPNDRLLAETACGMARISFALKTIESGVDAFRYLSGSPAYADRAEHPLPDLIFLDLKMPEIDGFDVLRWIRN